MSIADIKHSIDYAKQERSELLRRLEEIYQSNPHEMTPGDRDEAYRQLSNNYVMIDIVEQRINELQDQLQAERSLYKRPSGIIARWFSKPLGPLPNRMLSITADETAEGPSYTFTSLVTLLGTLVFMVLLSLAMPWLLISPFTVLTGLGVADSAPYIESIKLLIAFIALAIAVAKPRAFRRAIYAFAIQEEQWFRSGAESWSFRQRFVSCVMFGLAHVVNVIYPLITMASLMIVGAIMMLIYLRNYQRTGDIYRATLASARFHAAYNLHAIRLFLLASFILLFIG